MHRHAHACKNMSPFLFYTTSESSKNRESEDSYESSLFSADHPQIPQNRNVIPETQLEFDDKDMKMMSAFN